jgi:hypothetical protein
MPVRLLLLSKARGSARRDSNNVCKTDSILSKERMMLIRKRSISVLLVVLLLSQISLARNNVNDWNNVRILDIGSTITVKTKQGEKYEGELDFATVNSISITVTVPRVLRQVISIRKDEVKEVHTKLSRGVSTAIGAGIGLGVGIGLGQIADSKDKYGEDPGLGKLVGGMLGILWGAVGGAAIGFGSRKVYQAP